MKLKKKPQSEPPHWRWVGGPGPGGGAAASAAVVGARPPLGEASLRADGMTALKRLHVLVLLHLPALAGAGGARRPAATGRAGPGPPVEEEPGPGRSRSSPPGAGPRHRRPLCLFVCLFVCVGPPPPPRADLHRAARRVLIETLPRVFRRSGRGEEAPIKTKISCFNGLLN